MDITFQYRGYEVQAVVDVNIPYGAWRLFTKLPGATFAKDHGPLAIAVGAEKGEVEKAAKRHVDYLFTATVLKEVPVMPEIALKPEDQMWAEYASPAAQHRQDFFREDKPWTCNCAACVKVRGLGHRRMVRLLRYGEQFVAGPIVTRPTKARSHA